MNEEGCPDCGCKETGQVIEFEGWTYDACSNCGKLWVRTEQEELVEEKA